ncbi:MAG: hypothetical protein ABI691_07710 [Ginsengibacter sp.]
MKFKAFEIAIFQAAILSMIFSIVMWFVNSSDLSAVFIGLWVPSILGFGIFIKLKLIAEKK